MLELAYAEDTPEKALRLINQKKLDRLEFKKSFNRPCSYASYVSEKFPATYVYGSGLIFSTEAKPLKCVPFDEWQLRQGLYLAGFEKFMFDDIETMIKTFPDAIAAQKAANLWRKAYDLILKDRFDSAINFWQETGIEHEMTKALKFVYGSVETAKQEIERWKDDNEISIESGYGISYEHISDIKADCTEIIFDGEIPIEPLATFGFKEPLGNLPRFKSALDYFVKK